MKPLFFRSQVRVRYADTDQMKFAYYGKYFEYFEQARTDLLREAGLPYSKLEEEGIMLPVVEAHARYLRPARYEDLLEIEVRINNPPAASIHIDYIVYHSETRQKLAEGYTVLAFMNAANGRPMRAPEKFLKALGIG